MLRVVKPLCGIAEAGVHWFVTYQNHHKDKLEMANSTFDPCLLISRSDSTTVGLTAKQTDDTLSVGEKAFATKEEKEIERAGLRHKHWEEPRDSSHQAGGSRE